MNDKYSEAGLIADLKAENAELKAECAMMAKKMEWVHDEGPEHEGWQSNELEEFIRKHLPKDSE